MIRYLLSILTLLSCLPANASFIYGFDGLPRGKNSGTSLLGDLQFYNNPRITLSPFDANRDGDIYRERALMLQRNLGQYAQASITHTAEFTGPYTLEAFIRVDQLPEFDSGNSANMRRGILRLDKSGMMLINFHITRIQDSVRLQTLVRQRSSSGFTTLTGTTPMVLGRWYHAMLKVDDRGNNDLTNDAAHLYLNGEIEASVSNQAFEYMPGFTTLFVGTVMTTSRAFDGALDQVRVMPGITNPTLLDEVPNARVVLEQTPRLTIEGNPENGTTTLRYVSQDNGIYHVLFCDDALSENMTYKPAGILTLNSSTLEATWTDEGNPNGEDFSSGKGAARPAPDETRQRYYRIAFEPYTESTEPSVKAVLRDTPGDFDPWNQERWAYWYSGGKLSRSFVIDTSLKFASRSTPWEVDLSGLPERWPNLFIIEANESYDIDGNGVIIDSRLPHTKGWDLQYYYTRTINTAEDFGAWMAFHFRQRETASEDDPGTRVRNCTLLGFRHAIDFNHWHRRKVTISHCTFRLNIWALFPRGQNVVVSHCDIRESPLGGFYGEYNATNYVFEYNTFQDNDLRGVNSYGGAVLDACYGFILRHNQFLPPSYTPRTYHTAISFYRNRGEEGDIREHASHSHLIEHNTIDGYNVAIDFSVREGWINVNDQSKEGRCYSNHNIIRNNIIKNSVIGILVRTHHNVIDNNTFENVEREIALLSVFYKNQDNLIINQPDSTVWLWAVASDYTPYAKYVPYGNGVGASIPKREKLFHVRSSVGRPTFTDPSPARFILADNLLVDGSLKDTYSVGGLPIGVAVGDFAVYEPGDEIAVIWDQPVSNISGQDYYTIIFYNRHGVEMDRCGRSERRWSAITAGNFLPDTGFIPENANYEIAASQSEPDENGKYPIYIFRKGWMEPAVILLPDNDVPWLSLAAGNFLVSGDEYSEVAALSSDPARGIVYVKPSDPLWQMTTTGIPDGLFAIAAGNFDGNVANGDEVAGITRRDPRTALVAAWDFLPGDAGPLADKAPSGSSADNLTIVGQVELSDGKAIISVDTPGALRALASPDLNLKDTFTIWIRAKVVSDPSNFISLVDKRRVTSPMEYSYAFLINRPDFVEGGLQPNRFGIGGQISKLGSPASLVIADTDGPEVIPTGVIRELVMLCTRKGTGLELTWLASKVENPQSAEDWQIVNGPTANANVDSIHQSALDFFIGSSSALTANSATVEYEEIRIYNTDLTLKELAAIEPGTLGSESEIRYPVYFFRPGGSGSYQTSAANATAPWTAIASGDFDGLPAARDEVALARSVPEAGIYPVDFFAQGFHVPFKTAKPFVLGVPVRSLSAGKALVENMLSDYEHVEGLGGESPGTVVNSWGDHVAALPIAAQTTSIPMFWIGADPFHSGRNHIRTVPLLR